MKHTAKLRMQNLFLSIAAAFALGACANTAGSGAGATQASAQVAAELCPPLQAAIAALQIDAGLPAAALSDIGAAAPQVARVCAGAALANADDAATLQNLAFSVVLPVAQEQNPKLAADLLAAQIVITAMEQARLAAQAGGAAATASPTPAAPQQKP